MHHRLFPISHRLRYSLTYLALPLSRLAGPGGLAPLPLNRPALLSFQFRDHGWRDGSEPLAWARQRLEGQGLHEADGEILLLAMPRVLGYLFNPVSFWFCHDKAGALRAVICEVNNTFGESHAYVCAHADHRAILPGDSLGARKAFHVSPFLAREGRYRFRFRLGQSSLAVRVDHFDEAGEPRLLTSLAGRFMPLDRAGLRRALLRDPLMTLKVTMRIHWHALRLWLKGVRFHRKPPQLADRVSATTQEGKMKHEDIVMLRQGCGHTPGSSMGTSKPK